jgi:hydroxymethylglutaryl-CoA lyase
VPLDAVADVVGRMRDLGCDEIDIADTIGVATPRKTQAVMETAARAFALEGISGHFHDTYGQALANIYASLEIGVAIFHSSVSGLGGCPYAKGATGNVATEDVLYMLNGLGIETGIDLDQVVDAGRFISQQLGRKGASRAGNALLAKRAGENGRGNEKRPTITRRPSSIYWSEYKDSNLGPPGPKPGALPGCATLRRQQ